MTKQKNPFLTSKSSNAYAKEKCFVSRANACCFPLNKRLPSSAGIVSRSEVITIWSHCLSTMCRLPGNATSYLSATHSLLLASLSLLEEQMVGANTKYQG